MVQIDDLAVIKLGLEPAPLPLPPVTWLIAELEELRLLTVVAAAAAIVIAVLCCDVDALEFASVFDVTAVDTATGMVVD